MLNGKMLIEIRKAGFLNKGAELMLLSVLEKIKNEFPDAVFAMSPTANAPYLNRARSGFYQKAQLWRYGFQFGVFANLIPSKIRRMYGVVLNEEVDIVIDAAGFSYSDQWGKHSCSELANSCKRWKKNGSKIIILPQAFGPFKDKYTQKAMRSVVNNVDLIFAREKVSYDYLVDVVGKPHNLKMAGDFTNLIEGIIPPHSDENDNGFCIVPNYRMIDKTSKKDSKAYLPFMTEVTRYAYEKDQRPFILIHDEENDLTLAEQIRDSVSADIEIVKESHPLKIKGILGASSATVGSRFHGLVSALSQGTPALATGWSHKYRELFKDYGFPEGLLSLHMSKKELHAIMDLIIDSKSKEKIVNTINQESQKLKKQSNRMWDEVIGVLKK